MAQRDRENRVTLPSVKINFTERSVSHDEEKEKTDSRGEERFQGMVTFTYLDFREKSGRLPEWRLSQHLTGLADPR
jgi:hypothetical protein